MKMTHDRYVELMEDELAELTDDEIEYGYLFCCEWDGLLIHKDDLEAEACACLMETQE
jgi:hypothetical protein